MILVCYYIHFEFLTPTEKNLFAAVSIVSATFRPLPPFISIEAAYTYIVKNYIGKKVSFIYYVNTKYYSYDDDITTLDKRKIERWF